MIILNWNRSEDTIRAVESVLNSEYARIRILVVDNGSFPENRDKLSFLADKVDFIFLPENHGFARAVNIGAALAFKAGAEYILLLNNDANLEASSNVVTRLVETLNATPSVAAVGPCIINDDPERTVQSRGFFYRNFFPLPIAPDRGKSTLKIKLEPRKIDFIMGACVLFRGSAFASVNGFDPDFFFLAEDVDIMLRLRAKGLHEVVLHDEFVVHRKSTSIMEGSPKYAYTAIRSNLILVSKHANVIEGFFGFSALLLGSLLLMFRSATSSKGAGPIPPIRAWRDFLLHRWGGFEGVWTPGYEHPDFVQLWDAAGPNRAIPFDTETAQIA